jgi:hypothetical protein
VSSPKHMLILIHIHLSSFHTQHDAHNPITTEDVHLLLCRSRLPEYGSTSSSTQGGHRCLGAPTYMQIQLGNHTQYY